MLTHQAPSPNPARRELGGLGAGEGTQVVVVTEAGEMKEEGRGGAEGVVKNAVILFWEALRAAEVGRGVPAE